MTAIKSLTLKDIAESVLAAFSLLKAYPLRWLGFALLFLLCVEPLMFIPYVGFAIKLALSSIFAAQMLMLGSEAAAHKAPSVKTLLAAFRIAPPKLTLLVLTTWIMFAIGIAWLWVIDGDASVRYFLGNILVDAAPSTGSFTQFKLVLFAAGTLLSFVPPVIVLTSTPSTDVLPLAFKAAFANAPLLIFSLAISVGLELAMTPLGAFGVVGAVLSLCVTVLSVMWGFAFAYVASSRVLGSL